MSDNLTLEELEEAVANLLEATKRYNAAVNELEEHRKTERDWKEIDERLRNARNAISVEIDAARDVLFAIAVCGR